MSVPKFWDTPLSPTCINILVLKKQCEKSKIGRGNIKKRGNKKSGESITPIRYNVIAHDYFGSSFRHYLVVFQGQLILASHWWWGNVQYSLQYSTYTSGDNNDNRPFIFVQAIAVSYEYNVWMLSVWVLGWFPLIQGIYTVHSTWKWWCGGWKLVLDGPTCTWQFTEMLIVMLMYTSIQEVLANSSRHVLLRSCIIEEVISSLCIIIDWCNVTIITKYNYEQIEFHQQCYRRRAEELGNRSLWWYPLMNALQG